jgi:hypothetical protein
MNIALAAEQPPHPGPLDTPGPLPWGEGGPRRRFHQPARVG